MTTRSAQRKREQEAAAAEVQRVREHGQQGLRLTPGAQARIGERLKTRQRTIVSPPRDEQHRREVIAAARRSHPDLDPVTFLSLEALRQLAEEGNRFAALLFESECRRLGLWYERKLWTPAL